MFSLAVQRSRLPKDVFKKLQNTLEQRRGAGPLDSPTRWRMAMKEWALENGATHFTHVFQPLTGSTAEKHDSFFDPTDDGTSLAEFSGRS